MKKIISMLKANIWELVILLGIAPFIYVIVSGIYNAIVGFSGLCITGCTDSYGISAFIDWVLLFSFVFWPAYVVGLILMILGIIMVRRKNKEQ